jgi:ABC-2 type transport system ATP-binding protein
MSEILRLENISKNYGNFKAVDNLSFNVKQGEIIGFLGLNGSGKTTTIKILAGLLYEYEGTLFYRGKKEKNIGNKKETTFIFDSQNFYENLTAYENLFIISCLNKKIGKKEILKVLEEIGLADWIYKPVKFFSRGMKQRLALSSALLLNPSFLILDEPTNGLDIDGIYFCENYFSKLASQGCTILLSSHYLEEVERLADHIVIIHRGIKKFDGDKQSLSVLKIIGANYFFKQNIEGYDIEKMKVFFNNNGINPISLIFKENNFEITFDKDSLEKIELVNNFVKENFNGLLFIQPIQKHLKELFFNQS